MFLKLKAIEYKGGKCQICGYDSYVGALEFHHTDPSKKNFSISEKGLTRSFALIKAELDKCVLLCSNCHKEFHAGLWNLNELDFNEMEEVKLDSNP